jgi:hypothetical protein
MQCVENPADQLRTRAVTSIFVLFRLRIALDKFICTGF